MNIKFSQNFMELIIPYIDHTSLSAQDTEETIKLLCAQVQFPNLKTQAAAVCVLPKFVSLAKQLLVNTQVKVVTVANFPLGESDINQVCNEIKTALSNGADEIDVVFPYKRYLDEDQEYAHDFVRQCREVCPKPILLKVILETGVYPDTAEIITAARLAIQAGADFIKTSTGTCQPGASPEAVTAILTAIKSQNCAEKKVGIKISGGLRDLETIKKYWNLLAATMGSSWLNPENVRFGSSKLLAKI